MLRDLRGNFAVVCRVVDIADLRDLRDVLRVDYVCIAVLTLHVILCDTCVRSVVHYCVLMYTVCRCISVDIQCCNVEYICVTLPDVISLYCRDTVILAKLS